MIDPLAKQHAPILHFHPEEGSFCCFPSDAEAAYQTLQTGSHTYPKLPKELSAFPCYYRISPDVQTGLTRVQYWIWYNYDDFPAPFNIPIVGDHYGDWEHFEVILLPDNSATRFFLSNHTGARQPLLEELERSWDGRAHLWVAKGSHAHYESPQPRHSWPFDQIEDGGAIADTQSSLVDILNTTFYQDGFVGDWGFGAGIFSPPKRPVDENAL